MEINKCSNSAITSYNKITNSIEIVKRGNSVVPIAAPKNVDKAEFSSAYKSKTVDSSKADIKKIIDGDASPERIAALKSMIADGTYNIPAESIALSILEG